MSLASQSAQSTPCASSAAACVSAPLFRLRGSIPMRCTAKYRMGEGGGGITHTHTCTHTNKHTHTHKHTHTYTRTHTHRPLPSISLCVDRCSTCTPSPQALERRRQRHPAAHQMVLWLVGKDQVGPLASSRLRPHYSTTAITPTATATRYAYLFVPHPFCVVGKLLHGGGRQRLWHGPHSLEQ